MKKTRNKKMISFALDPKLIEEIDNWIEKQTVPPTKTAVIEMALCKFIRSKGNG